MRITIPRTLAFLAITTTLSCGASDSDNDTDDGAGGATAGTDLGNGGAGSPSGTVGGATSVNGTTGTAGTAGTAGSPGTGGSSGASEGMVNLGTCDASTASSALKVCRHQECIGTAASCESFEAAGPGSCTALNGTYDANGTTCPTANSVGTCKTTSAAIVTSQTWYMMTTAEFQSACATLGGIFTNP